jgi:uncharacterized RDD family membrane protein YckC
MDAAKMTDLAARVCPRCGDEAGEHRFCQSCGLNLAEQTELPTAEEYSARLRQEQWLRSQKGASSPGQAALPTTAHATAQLVATEAASAPLAGWWLRAGGIIIDTLILCFAAFVVGFLFGPLLGFIAYLGAVFAYFMLMVRDSQNGQSLGMQAVGIRVRRVDGKPVDVQTVAIRQFLMQTIVFGIAGFLLVPVLLNYLWPLWDRDNRALHDMVAKTRVVRA